LAKPIASHCTAFALHLYGIFLHFLLHVSQLAYQKVVKSAKKGDKNAKKVQNLQRYAKKCKMQTQCENGIKICITLHHYSQKKNAFSHFFALHSHRTTILEIYLPMLQLLGELWVRDCVLTSHRLAA
jgi:hypothetical protein